MKALIRTLVVLLILGGLVAGGVYGYSRYAMAQPVPVQSAGNWLLEYAPNQTYLGGSVISGDSLTIYPDKDRTILEVFVTEGQAVKAGDPLLRYDTTKNTLDLDEKLLNRQKLYDELQGLYKDYRRYAYTDYERTIPTATPKPTPTPRGYTPVSAPVAGGLAVTRLSAPILREVRRIDQGADGSEADPYQYEILGGDPIPGSLLSKLQAEAAQQPVYAWLKTDVGYVYLRFVRPESEAVRVNFSVAATTEKRVPTVQVDGDTLQSTDGDGSLKDPYIFNYTEGQEITGAFVAKYSQRASALGKYIYTELRGSKLTVAVDFTSMGTCILRLKLTPQPTPTPTATPTPSPTPTESPTPEPTEVPEGWDEYADDIYIPPAYYGMSREERLALVRELAEQIRNKELTYKQLCHDIDILRNAAENGTLVSDVDGVVTALNPLAKSGETLLEVRGGSGKGVISCMLGETELEKYPVGTELTGFSYEIGSSVTAVVTYVSPMPVTDSYSNGGNPNSSGYTMLLEVQGTVELPLYSYVEFTSYEPLSKSGAIYLYEAFVREIDGQDCIFVAKDGVLRKVQVHTGRRMMEYIELVGSDLTREDYIAFPYGKNVRDGAPTEITENIW